MSTTEVLKRNGADLQSTDERARAAVKAFHRMQPSLTAYARALTGKSDVQVVVSPDSNGHTNGKKIFFRPPLALGDNTPHKRALCDKRDPDTLRQMCPACDIHEQVVVVIYHEIAHIVEGSFEEMSENQRAEALKYGLSLVDKKYAAAVMERVMHAPSHVKVTYIGMSSLISPYLPGIVNALEDARVNAGASRARKGTKIMFQVDTMRVLSEGFENKMPDGTVQRIYWRDRPLNAQMICAIYARAAGYPMDKYFVPEVVDALNDEHVKEILSDFPTIRNAKGVYTVAIALLMRLRELGFYQHHTDPTTESDEEQQDDEQQEAQDDSGDSSGSDSLGEPEPSSEDDSQRESGEGDGSEEASESTEGDADSGSEPGEADDAHSEDESSDGGAEESDAGSDGDGSDEQASADDGGGSSSEEDGADNSDGSGESQGPDSGDDAADDTGSQEGSGDAGKDDSESSDVSDEGEVGDDQGDSDSDQSGNSSGSSEGGELRQDGFDSEGEEGEDSSAGTGSDHQSDEGESVPGDSSTGDLGSGQPEDVGTGESGGSPGESSLQGPSNSGGSDLAWATPEESDETPSDSVAQDTEDGDPSGQRTDDGSADSSVIDTGADEGLGGVEVIEDSAFDRLPMGEPDEVNGTIHEVAHPEERPSHVKEEAAASKAMDVAIIQGLYFETPSRAIHGVREHYYDSPIYVDGHNMSRGWDDAAYSGWGYSRRQLGMEGEFECDEKTLGPALLHMRVAFADNQRGHDMRHRKSGKVDPRVLGKRARLGDDRLFKRRIIPGKKDYFVLIGVDISGSTVGRNIVLAKRAAMAQAELCARMGINFAVYAHSGNFHLPDYGRSEGMDLEIYHLKDPDEPWTEKVKKRLLDIGPDSANLDGHTFEYYRKILDTRTETHRVILYYTDGKMPAENHDEELEILQREIKICKQRKYVLLGVGIRTDSPTAHGLDTVQVDGDEDIVKVVKHLEKRLLEIV